MQRAILLHGTFKWGRSAWHWAEVRLVVGCNKSVHKNVNLKINYSKSCVLIYKLKRIWEGACNKIRISYAEFSFWVRGVLSRCSGVVTMAFWLHTGVDVRDGFSKSWLSCFVHMLRNWKNKCHVSQIKSKRQTKAKEISYEPEMEKMVKFWQGCS